MLSTLYRFAVRDGMPPATPPQVIYSPMADNSPTYLGIPSLWSGLSASLLRQATYSTARFGLYNTLSRRLQSASRSPSSKPSAAATIACAGIAGGLAGMIGNPAEVVLVRMCADGAKAPAERFLYPNPLVALYRISRDEGLKALGRGMSANIVRSVLMSTRYPFPWG